jgi:soluble lytic murein transglycosylase-like protein
MKFVLTATSAAILNVLVAGWALAETDAAGEARETAAAASSEARAVKPMFHQSQHGPVMDSYVERPTRPAAEPEQEAAESEDAGEADAATEAASNQSATTEATEKPIQEQTRVSGYAANPYGSLISSYAEAHGISESLAHAVVRVESNFRSDATGAAGEIGLMQLKLSTARMMGYSGSRSALYDPETNIKYGMRYLAKAQSLSDGSTCGTILKYNAGHGAKRMNPVSARYCSKVSALLQ